MPPDAPNRFLPRVRRRRRPAQSAGSAPLDVSIIITGGGTAGHTNPGIAVAQALVERGVPRHQVHFVGGARGNEGTLVTEAGFSIDLLPGRGIQRRLTAANIGAVISLIVGTIKGLAIVAKRRPDAVLCLGGYAAFAASAAAVALRIPLVVTEQNARASAVNRLFGSRARRCALPFPDTDLPNGVVTGNPIRAEVVDAVTTVERPAARRAIVERYRAANPDSGLDPEALADRVVLAVWAGSLGATRINTAITELASAWADRSDLAIYHVVGRRDWDRFRAPVAQPDGGLLHLTVDYENHMADVLVGADLALCRSGASTVSELAVAGLPALLIPLPHAPRDHQRANTAELVAAGAAVVLDDGEVTGERLATALAPLIADGDRRRMMAQAAAAVARPRAADAVAALLLEAAGLPVAPDPSTTLKPRNIDAG